jgi:membrane associated rhomboid family serine protease
MWRRAASPDLIRGVCDDFSMDESPQPGAAVGGTPGSEPVAPERDEEIYCYAHRNTPTRLRCSRCDRPICGRCAIPASVGQHCPECVAEARRSAPKVHSTIRAAAPAVVVLLCINIVMYVLQNFEINVTLRLALIPRAVADGEWWRLLTSMFLHSTEGRFGVMHIVFNMVALYIYGPYVEKAYGHLRFVLMYLLAGFFAAAASYAFGPVSKIALGASGAIFGLIGILIAYAYRRRTSAFIRGFLQSLLVILAINLYIGFTSPFIDNYAHIGGLVAGLALGYGLDRQQQKGASAIEATTVVLVLMTGLILVVYQSLQLA